MWANNRCKRPMMEELRIHLQKEGLPIGIPLGADQRQPHLTLTSASRARDWVWDRPHPMKAGGGEAGPGDPPDFLGFSPSQLRIHHEEPEVPEEEARGGDEAEAPALVQLIDEHGTYSTARLVPDVSAEERSGKEEPGSLRSGSEGREGLARPRQFSCAACGRAFKRAWELLSHEVVHTAARPFRCGLCAAAFKRHSDCKGHRPVHSDERPHGCDACGKRFKRASNLQVRRGGRSRREAGVRERGRGEQWT
nr:zinc finger protein 92 homolog isoform X3 [Globicephala melas]